MKKITVQVCRNGEWMNVSSVSYEPNRDSARRVGPDMMHTRETAIKEGTRALTAWQGSHQFTGLDLRLVDRDAYGDGLSVVIGRTAVAA